MNLHQYYKENKDEINSSIMKLPATWLLPD